MKDDKTGKRALKLVPPGKRRPERLNGTGRSQERLVPKGTPLGELYMHK